jgi:hypothetical protein
MRAAGFEIDSGMLELQRMYIVGEISVEDMARQMLASARDGKHFPKNRVNH